MRGIGRVCSWLGLLALGWQVGCGARQPPAPPANPAPPLAPPAPPLAPPAPPPGAGRLLDAVPSDLAPELAAQIAFLSDLCAPALHYEAGGAHRVSAGCRVCPPFEGPSAAPDGKIAVDGEDFFALEALIAGHFTDAALEQRLAVFSGCEPHTDNRGGTVLAEPTGGRFRVRSYFSDLHPQSCQAYRRPDGRDIAVCELTDAHQSVSTDELSAFDFSVDPPSRQTLLSFTNHDLCLEPLGTRGGEEQIIEGFELNQNPIAKNNGLVVHLASRTRTMTPEYQRFCHAEAATPSERPYAKTKLITRRFQYEGSAFVAR